ncbi:MAG: hypothetical protein ACRC6R_02280 [Bacteroidales bacterium]
MRIFLLVAFINMSHLISFSQFSTLERSFIYSDEENVTDLYFIEVPSEPGVVDVAIYDSPPWIVLLIFAFLYMVCKKLRGINYSK